jgi:hypothetical protein
MAIERISAETFRKELAFGKKNIMPEENRDYVFSVAVDFTVLLHDVFGAELDIKTVWERSANALKNAAGMCDGDMKLFVSSCADFVKADLSLFAANPLTQELTPKILSFDTSEKEELLKTVTLKTPLVVLMARNKVIEKRGAEK